MTGSRRMAVIGADAVSMTAASQARRMCGPEELGIVGFERGSWTSYSACGLPYLLSGLVALPEKLVARTPEQFAERSIDVHMHHEVTGIDTTKQTLTVRDLDAGTERTESWDELVIGTGARGVKPPLDGINSEGVHQLRTLDDAAAIERRLAAGASDAVVVGAGYIGLEAAEALVDRGLKVTMMEMADSPMATTLDPDMAELVSEAVRAAGVDLRLGAAVTEFEHSGDSLTGVATEDASVRADLALIGLGVRPNSELAADAGIELGTTGGIRTDSQMRTSAEGVWAGGDCAEVTHHITGAPMLVALGTHANKHGRIIGTNIGGGTATFPGVLGTAITKFRELEIARTGLTTREAEAAGVDVSVSVAHSDTRARYYPGSSEVTVKTLVRRSDGVLVGAQVIGGPGAGKRIDALAVATWVGMTVDDLSMADLSYAPPVSPVWDPVVFAAGVAANALHD